MNHDILILLRKYLDDQCSSAELEQVRMILSRGLYEEEWNAVLQDDAETIMAGENALPPDLEKQDKILERIAQSTSMETVHPLLDEGNGLRSLTGRQWFRVAATILVILTAGLVFMFIKGGDFSETVTATGEQKEVLLSDGTRVWLNDESTLRYPDRFDGETREVYLDGSAYFEVPSVSGEENLQGIPSRPFLVYTEELTVTVLGTSFNVRAYKDDNLATVAVASGSVRVLGPIPTEGPAAGQDGHIERMSILTPGEHLAFNKKSRSYHHQAISMADVQILKENPILFQDQPLEDITRALERRYDIRFRYGRNAAPDERLTFKPNSSDLDEILHLLSLVSGYHVERNNKQVFIR